MLGVQMVPTLLTRRPMDKYVNKFKACMLPKYHLNSMFKSLTISLRDLRVPFPTAREAEIAYNSLRVDPEPKRSGVKKELSVDGTNLCV